MARPLLTLQLADAIAADIRGGAYMQDACRRHGIAERTVYVWIRRADDALATHDGEDLPEDHPEWLYVQFAQAVEDARAHARVAAAAAITLAIRGRPARSWSSEDEDGNTVHNEVSEIRPDWRAAIAYLERTDPENWGRVWRGRPGQDAGAQTPGTPVPGPASAEDTADTLSGLVARLDDYRAAHEARLAAAEQEGTGT